MVHVWKVKREPKWQRGKDKKSEQGAAKSMEQRAKGQARSALISNLLLVLSNLQSLPFAIR